MAFFQDLTSGITAAVDTTSKAIRNALYDTSGRVLARKDGAAKDSANDEALLMAGINDGNIRHFRTDRLGSQSLALNGLLFTDQFEGTTLNANKWLSTSTTMTAVQSAAVGITFNGSNLTTTAVGHLLRSLRTFMKPLRSVLHAKIRLRMEHYTGANFEAGFGDVSTHSGSHTNGAFIQRASDGVVTLVWVYNGTPLTSAPVLGLNDANYYTADLLLDDDQVTMFIQDTSTGLIVAERTINLPMTAPKQSSTTRYYAFMRQWHTSAPATAPHLYVPVFDVVLLDNQQNKPWATITAGMGNSAEFNPATGVQLINYANSAAPASATLSNTAAGYTTLGGLFQFAAVAGAATDYALFGFTVPAPFSLHVKGIDFETWNTGAAVATTPTLLNWGVGVNQSAVSLATAGIVRKSLGAQSLPIGAVPGAKAERVSVVFDAPLITDAGRIFTVMLRMPVASATASQIVQGMVNINGYFE